MWQLVLGAVIGAAWAGSEPRQCPQCGGPLEPVKEVSDQFIAQWGEQIAANARAAIARGTSLYVRKQAGALALLVQNASGELFTVEKIDAS